MIYLDTQSRYTHYTDNPRIRGRRIREMWVHRGDGVTNYAYYQIGVVLLSDITSRGRIINQRQLMYGVSPCYVKRGRYAKR